jgi:hypothetical protein
MSSPMLPLTCDGGGEKQEQGATGCDKQAEACRTGSEVPGYVKQHEGCVACSAPSDCVTSPQLLAAVVNTHARKAQAAAPQNRLLYASTALKQPVRGNHTALVRGTRLSRSAQIICMNASMRTSRVIGNPSPM